MKKIKIFNCKIKQLYNKHDYYIPKINITIQLFMHQTSGCVNTVGRVIFATVNIRDFVVYNYNGEQNHAWGGAGM